MSSLLLAGVLAGCGAGTGRAAIPPTSGDIGTRGAQAGASFAVVDGNSGSTSFAPLGLAWPKGAPNTGDLLVGCVEAQFGNLPATPAGWTALYSAKNAFGTALFYKIAGNAEPATVSFAIPAPYNVSATMLRIAGASPVAPLWSHVQSGGTAKITTAAIVPTSLGMLPVACFTGVGAGSFAVASGWSAVTQNAAVYGGLFEQQNTLTTDTKTAISVASAPSSGTKTSQADAYGLLVAPASTATASPTPAPTPTPTATPGTLSVADSASGTSSFAPVTLSWPKGAPNFGDLLVACVEAQYGNAPSAPAGWTALFSANGAFGTGLFYKTAGSAEPNAVAFSIPTPYNVSASMIRISGASANPPAWSHSENFSVASISTAALVPSVSGMLPLACVGGVNAGSYSFPAGWTTATRSASTYVNAIAAGGATTDTVTPISVTAAPANGTQTYQSDAYGLLVAPAAAAGTGVTVQPASIAFLGTAAAAQTVVATQSGNTSFTASTINCAAVATLTKTGNGAFSVVPVAAGSCTFTISGTAGSSVALPVTVTTTTITSQ